MRRNNKRKPYTMNFKVRIMDAFKQHCEEIGAIPSKRIEVLMLNELYSDNNLNTKEED